MGRNRAIYGLCERIWVYPGYPDLIRVRLWLFYFGELLLAILSCIYYFISLLACLGCLGPLSLPSLKS